ncbi:PAP2 superfamily protein [Sphingopyxis sp. YR583]|uniref:phosphatase PAP2 family protein n=1 Tax=Sphingopyxis sp. YR583 TaxID=1881047 RepID=UPI0008A7AB28|nr:phosphatase PAP2 family protein [Sphingopyxis sp. YR583]SEH20086.1 PAP2 superfamily protein [Sphingopyxis sp. YR583]
MSGPASSLRRGLTEDRAILTGGLIIWALFMGLLATKGVNGFRPVGVIANLILYLSALLFAVVVVIAARLWRHRPDRPLAFLGQLFTTDDLGVRLARGAPMLIALAVFMPAFSAMKGAIPLFNAYVWDDSWIALDRALHGADAWRLLQPIVGYPIVSSALSILYHLWILLIYAGGIWFCFFVDDRKLRARFLISYFACWTLIGVVMATALASVGPCFLAPMLGDSRFEEQMAYLRHANTHFPIMVLQVQDQLAAWHQAGNEGLGRGISAMPSMHVSLAFLFFLAMRHVSRRAGLFFGTFFVAILIGSVHLAYHYAVDGYVSIAVTGLLWVLAGQFVRRSAAAGQRSPAMA